MNMCVCGQIVARKNQTKQEATVQNKWNSAGEM